MRALWCAVVMGIGTAPAGAQWQRLVETGTALPGGSGDVIDAMILPLWWGDEAVVWVRDNTSRNSYLLGLDPAGGPGTVHLETGDVLPFAAGPRPVGAIYPFFIFTEGDRLAFAAQFANDEGGLDYGVYRWDRGAAGPVFVADNTQALPVLGGGPGAPSDFLFPAGWDGDDLLVGTLGSVPFRVFRQSSGGALVTEIQSSDAAYQWLNAVEGGLVGVSSGNTPRLALLDQTTETILVDTDTPWPADPANETFGGVWAADTEGDRVVFIAGTGPNVYQGSSGVFEYDLMTGQVTELIGPDERDPWFGQTLHRFDSIAVENGAVYVTAEPGSYSSPSGPGNMVLRLDPDGGVTLLADARLHLDEQENAGLQFVPSSIRDGRVALKTFSAEGLRLWSLTEPLDDVAGDFNLSGEIDAGDLDVLWAATRSNLWANGVDSPLDLDANGWVNTLDYAAFLNDLDPLEGDANLDGFISQTDLDAVLLNWGSADTAWSGGDFNADGTVSQADLDAVLLGWGNTRTYAWAGDAASRTVPEPGAAAMGLLLMLAGQTGRRRP